jgi:hypothetical protein
LGGLQYLFLWRTRHCHHQHRSLEIGEIIVSNQGENISTGGIWRRIETPVLINGLASLFAIGIAAARVNKTVAVLAALAFAASIVVEGIRVTAKMSSAPSRAPSRAPSADAKFEILGGTTFLSFLTCVWSAAALFVAYPIAGLDWLHGWEYGLSFAVAALGFAVYLEKLAKHDDGASKALAVTRAKGLTILQAITITATLIWIIGSGKLSTQRGDWLANDVFLASGCAALALSAIFLIRTRALRR